MDFKSLKIIHECLIAEYEKTKKAVSELASEMAKIPILPDPLTGKLVLVDPKKYGELETKYNEAKIHLSELQDTIDQFLAKEWS